jgi:CRP-like cAMP-binding protein
MLLALRIARNRLEYLTENDWSLIADRAKQMTAPKGEVIIQQGKTVRIVFLALRGKAKVVSAAQATIAEIGPGEIAGEMSFLERAPASASVIAEEEMELLAIDWKSLEDLFELFPHLASRFYRSVAVNLSRRLRGQIVPKTK